MTGHISFYDNKKTGFIEVGLDATEGVDSGVYTHVADIFKHKEDYYMRIFGCQFCHQAGRVVGPYKTEEAIKEDAMEIFETEEKGE